MTRLPASVRCFVLASGLAASSVAAQPVDILTHTPPRVHEGQSVVRVTADSAREVQAALALSESLWSEGAAVGSFDIQIRTDRIAVLAEAGLEVEVRIADLQAHADRGWARVQAAERAIRARDPQPAARGAGPHDETWFENYKQLADIEAYVNALHAARPDLSTQSVAGQSLQNRPIRSITITGPDQPGNAAADRPVIIFNGCQHAREWVSPMTVTYIASRLISDYDNDPAVKSLVDSVRFVIVPVVNPDGYLHTWSGERFWRKNRRLNPSGDFGVDLNRNWGYEWGGDGASTSPNSDIFRGASPFSEPETRVLRDLALSFGDDLAAHIDYHTYSQLILYPFGYADGVQAPEPDRTFFDTLSTDMSDLIFDSSGAFYTPIPSWALYPASGTASDWFYGSADAKSLTVELRPSDQQVGGLDGFDPPPSTILPAARENFLAALLFADRTTQPLSFTASPPATVAAGEAAEVVFTVAPGLDALDPATVSAVAAIGAAPLAPAPVTPLGGGTYRVTLPVAVCGQPVSFAFSAATTDGRTVNYPQSGPFVADTVTVLFEDDMETDTGWTVGASGDTASVGVWERASPQATAAQPGADASAAGSLCWITGAAAGSGVGSFDVDNGSTTLTSPRLDASGDQTDLVYARWYSNDAGASPNTDTMPVFISNDDGATWITLEVVSENANAWVQRRFRVADFVTPTDRVRVRFVARDDAPGSIVEAGVDDLRLETAACDAPTADLAAPFGELNLFDVLAFLDLFNAQNPAADFDANGAVNFFDVTAFLGLFNAGL